jgi:hypothetical protein
VVRAHIFEGTLTWTELSKRLAGNGTASYTSLQGYVWKMKLGGERGNEYPVVIDRKGRTTEGFYNIQSDITEIDAGIWCASYILESISIHSVPVFLLSCGDGAPSLPPNSCRAVRAAYFRCARKVQHVMAVIDNRFSLLSE